MDVSFAESSSNMFGIKNGYRDPRQMGVDRWMAILAATRLYQLPVCIFDCGTAITADVIDTHGVHRGGYIIPGLNLAATLLDAGTDQICVDATVEASEKPGTTTAECVMNGYFIAVRSFINSVMQDCKTNIDENTVFVVTGGSAEVLLRSLPDEVNYNADLVLLGLGFTGEQQ